MNAGSACEYSLDGEQSVVVDGRGLPCPQPLLAMRRALREQPAGALLCVLATDPGSWRDFHSFAELSGRGLLKAEQRQGEFHYWLRAGALAAGKPNRI
ncbi:sulfurtransferase TusA family protein [Microbulbifer sediminum]|uniref:sulfurtransferase TusA family protein n=1 Tax=Microbulbifer sediminum TaxID=2904250 RepID=UPI001F4060B4|nr:sulfurtransferase TusA family protein [Microbulbifer sediminum]